MNNIRCALFPLVVLFAVGANSALGGPTAYSINSDSWNTETEDSLYRIDLGTGEETLRGKLISGSSDYDHTDIEGLAFAADGTLWGIDDFTLTLFPITTAGVIKLADVISLKAFPAGGGNDFGMSFDCNNSLYVSSVVKQTLYRLEVAAETSQIVGAEGALGADISALAAIGSPTRLYGLGNESDGPPGLYRIDTGTGVATRVGSLGADAGAYNAAGLAFDDEGTLWAITDRRGINDSEDGLPSEILRIDIDTGAAELVSTTREVGFESLAISPPGGCVYIAPITDPHEPYRIPTLGPAGRLSAVLALLLTGMIFLRRKMS